MRARPIAGVPGTVPYAGGVSDDADPRVGRSGSPAAATPAVRLDPATADGGPGEGRTRVDPDRLRRVVGHFATGVTVVTTYDGDRPWGTTVNSFSSVSLRPPLVMIAFDRGRRIMPALRATARYAVNILGEDQQSLSDCFSGAPVKPDRDGFCGAAWHPGATGLPILDASIASLECTIVDIHPAGDHDLLIARVDAVGNEAQHPLPLLYYRGRYLRIERATSTQLEGKPEH